MNSFTWKLMLIILSYMLIITAQAYGPMPLPEDGGFSGVFIAVTDLFSNWSELSYQYKIAGVLFIMVGLFKNSVFRPVWDSLGKWKPLVAPTLSLIAFLFMVKPFTLSTFIAAISTGAAAGYFSQILDALKTIPKIGYLSSFISDVVGKFLKK